MRVTVAVPCYNEAPTIAKVVSDFRAALPEAEILVFDNASTDGTAEEARKAGAQVFREKRRGKGYVVHRIFETVDADVCVLVDGDDTYFAEDVHRLIAPLAAEEADMVVGNRLRDASGVALSDLRRMGNHLIIKIMNFVFRSSFEDVLSGYRAMNRQFLEAVPLITPGFEIETELTLQGLEKGMVIREVPIRYRKRPEGSISKLSPFADGYRILITIALLLRNHRPLYFFSSIAAGLLAGGALYGAAWAAGRAPAVESWVHLLVVAGAILLAGGLVIVGVVLNAINTGFREIVSLMRRSP